MTDATPISNATIAPGFVLAFAAYNAEMNRRIYDAAERLPEIDRRRHRGAFWDSIHGTLSHLLWGDHMWMSRFDGWARPAISIKESPTWIEDFNRLRTERIAADTRISDWAERVTEQWLRDDLVWFSSASNREHRKSRGLLVMHFFNHQTHHRGQAHAMITAAGEQTGDTDLILVI
jgi:uncharacterized damage-inducible protein DinB